MLLTQTQVSAAISSTIVLAFTVLLFFAGYILQQQTVTSLRVAIRPRLQALKALPQAQAAPTTTTVAVSFGEAGAPLKLSADETATEQDVNVEGAVYEYLEDGMREEDTGTVGTGVQEPAREDDDEDDEWYDNRKDRVLSLDDWIYSDETEGQKRMREGLGVLDRWAQGE